MYQDVLTFWFEEIEPKMWWVSDPDFDKQVERRFLPLLNKAMQAELYDWRREPLGRLAEVIVLDQFSRNIHRSTPQAFAQDAMALALAQEAIAVNAHASLSAIERSFLYMPFMHSESKRIHQWAEQLFRDNGIKNNYDFELMHKAIIDRFDRYPHRNKVLGRRSTEAEIEFLSQPGSSF